MEGQKSLTYVNNFKEGIIDFIVEVSSLSFRNAGRNYAISKGKEKCLNKFIIAILVLNCPLKC